jgi:hypothetical protein
LRGNELKLREMRDPAALTASLPTIYDVGLAICRDSIQEQSLGWRFLYTPAKPPVHLFVFKPKF